MRRYDSYKDSGVEWLGEVPSHWEVQPLRTVTRLKADRNRPDLPVLSVYREYGAILKDSRDDNHNATSLDTSTYKAVKPGDLIVNKMKAWQGSMGVSVYAGIVSPAYITCSTNSERINPHFLHYLLRSEPMIGVYNALSYGVRIGQWDMHYEDFKTIPIPIPTMLEQDRIVAFLDEKTAEIDAAIAKKKRLIELLKEQKNILINRAVARGLNPDAPMRDSGVEWIGKIPAHWSLKRLCNLSRVVRGASPRPAGHPKYFTTEPIVPWVTAAEITKDESRYLTSTTEYLTVIGAKNSQAFSSGTVVFTNSGATLGVPKILAINCCANDGVLALKSLSPEIDKEFLYLFLSTTTVRLRDEMKQGGGQPNLNTGIVKNISIPIPDFDEQVAIVKFIDDYLAMNDSLLISASSQIDTLNSLKEVLISLAVFGKINVL